MEVSRYRAAEQLKPQPQLQSGKMVGIANGASPVKDISLHVDLISPLFAITAETLSFVRGAKPLPQEGVETRLASGMRRLPHVP